MTDISRLFYDELLADLEHNRLVLPTLPEVALKVREVVDDPDSSIADLVRIIVSDPALSARLIQVANSPLMRAGRKIESVDAAVSRLGMRIVRDLATSMVMQQMFQATSDVTDQRLRQLWEHSTEVAAICHALAGQFTKLNPEQALLAGLVHDIGAMPILTKAEDFPELLQDEKALDWVIRELHPRVGGAILRSWNFPPELVDVAEQHENLTYNSATVDFVDVVIVANLQSYLGSNHPLAEQDLGTIPAFAKLGLSPDVNVIEMEGTGDTIRETQQLLNI
ncbi:HDOD domain-containing protein [Sulfurivermis fontis]|uniref:HDOD domain-containing protein n=1 Tax=Sulfurivermis fontis TaxID=1972068 RepID=UPI000FD9A45A|nr:HDOD domain-containing protein [Sulfurivermis fontis]